MPSSIALYLLLFFFFILTLSNSLVLGESYNVYSWGLNMDGQTGMDLPTTPGSFSTPTLNQHVSSLLANPNSLYESVYNIATKPSDITISLKTIIPGYKYNLYWFTFTNTTSSETTDQLFSCGDNTDYCSGLKSPKFTTELQVVYEYSATSNNRYLDGSLSGKKLESVDCMVSCIACTKDGLVFVRTSSQKWAWYAVTIDSGLVDAQGITVSNKCKKVSVGGTTTSATYFVMTDSGHLFSWGEFNSAMRGYDDAEYSGTAPHLISTVFGAFEFAVLKDYDIPVNDGLGVLGYLNDTGLYLIGKNTYGLFGITVDDLFYLTPYLAIDSQVIGSKLKKIVFGYANALVLAESGKVYAFGGNDYGQVNPSGYGPYQESVAEISSVSGSVDCFCSAHACGCRQTGGSFKTWGSDKERGWTGAALFDYINFPESSSTFSLLTRGGFAISNTNKLYAWGDNTNGYMCLGEKSIQMTPKLLFSANYQLKQLVSGEACSYSLGESGGVSIVNMWGNCTNGLGFGIAPSGGYLFHNLTTLDNSLHLQGLKYSQLSMYNLHAGFLSSSTQQKPYMIGYGDSMRLGTTNLNDLDVLTSVDTTVLVNEDIVQVSAGYDHTVYLTRGGYLMGSGDNSKRQLDPLDISYSELLNISTTVIQEAGERIVKVVAGKQTTFVLTDAGHIWGKGSNEQQQISKNGPSPITEFQQLDPTTKNFTKLAVGTYPIACEAGGYAYRFSGDNKGPWQYFYTYMESCSDVFAKDDIYYFITNVGKVYAIGSNYYNQISTVYGLDEVTLTANMIFSPVKLGGMPRMIAVGNGFTSIGVEVPSYTCNGKNFSDPTVCNGKGYCISQNQCQCENSYWTGSDCSTPVCIPVEGGAICSGRGVCIAPDTCKCNSGYFGSRCETYYCFGILPDPYGMATTKPCNNRGSCKGPDTCECTSSEYYGDECQFKRCFSGNGAFLKRNSLADRLCNKINSQILNITYPIPTGDMSGTPNIPNRG